MSYVPEFVALYEIVPYIRNLPLNNETIRFAVKYYLEGGETRNFIIKIYGKIEDWNTSEVTDMSWLFEYCFDFNEDISDWDTSNVTTMYKMFAGAFDFNQPIGKWDTSSVIDMRGMFYCAPEFNQPIGKWNVSKVTTMENMFYGAESFNPENAPWYCWYHE